MLGFPAGFKPNINLAHFLGNYSLELIVAWKYVITSLVHIQKPIAIFTSFCGLLGFSVFLAALHDILFISSTYILFMYSVFAKFHYEILNMAKTLYSMSHG